MTEQSGWLRAIDEALVVHHIGIADPTDDFETAKRKLNVLLCVAQQIGEDFGKQALNLPEQEPVAWMWKDGTVTDDPDRADGTWTPLYTAPTPRKPLTDLEILAANKFMYNQHTCVYIQEDGEPENLIAFARAIERAHGIGEQT